MAFSSIITIFNPYLLLPASSLSLSLAGVRKAFFLTVNENTVPVYFTFISATDTATTPFPEGGKEAPLFSHPHVFYYRWRSRAAPLELDRRPGAAGLLASTGATGAIGVGPEGSAVRACPEPPSEEFTGERSRVAIKGIEGDALPAATPVGRARRLSPLPEVGIPPITAVPLNGVN